MLKRIGAWFSSLGRGIDPAGLGVQVVLTLGALVAAGWSIIVHATPHWVAPAAFLLGNGLGFNIHARWAVAERPLPRAVARTFAVRTEGLTFLISAGVIESLRAVSQGLFPELAAAVSAARLALGVAVVYLTVHAVMSAPVSWSDQARLDDEEARVRVPQRPPRLRLRSRSTTPDA